MPNKAYQFNREQPNPFAEPNAPAEAASENPYVAVTMQARASGADPVRYERTMPPRTGKLLGFAIGGSVAALISLGLAFLVVPLALMTLVMNCLAISMSWHDLAAMRQGAMDPATRTQLRVAFALSLLGVVLDVAAIVIMISTIVLLLFFGW